MESFVNIVVLFYAFITYAVVSGITGTDGVEWSSSREATLHHGGSVRMKRSDIPKASVENVLSFGEYDSLSREKREAAFETVSCKIYPESPDEILTALDNAKTDVRVILTITFPSDTFVIMDRFFTECMGIC